MCDAEVPRQIHVEVPYPEADVRFTTTQLTWNPPLPDGTFVQPPPQAMRVRAGHVRGVSAGHANRGGLA